MKVPDTFKAVYENVAAWMSKPFTMKDLKENGSPELIRVGWPISVPPNYSTQTKELPEKQGFEKH